MNCEAGTKFLQRGMKNNEYLVLMITKLPSWIWIGAWLLAFVAGIVNVVGLLGFQHQAITHLTGNTSLLAEALAKLDLRAVLHFSSLIGAFVAGTAISGFIIQDSTLQLGRRYGVALLLVSILLFISAPLLSRNSILGMYTAACACGLQNAMVSTYSGAVIRTTHLSGMFTDLGIYIGHALRGIPVDPKRLRLCVIVISGFLFGGIAGTLAFDVLSYYTLFLPASLTALISIYYGVYHYRNRQN